MTAEAGQAPFRSLIDPPPARDLSVGAADGSKAAWVAQLVEQRIENPRVGGSNPPPGTTSSKGSGAGRTRLADPRPEPAIAVAAPTERAGPINYLHNTVP